MAIDITSRLALLTLDYLRSIEQRLCHSTTNQRRHKETVQVPFMTEAKVWVLVSASCFHFDRAEAGIFCSPDRGENNVFFLVAVFVLTNITACYTAG